MNFLTSIINIVMLTFMDPKLLEILKQLESYNWKIRLPEFDFINNVEVDFRINNMRCYKR